MSESKGTATTLYVIEFLGDGNALFRFTTGAEVLVPASEAAEELERLYGALS
jgi:hypothetical protein